MRYLTGIITVLLMMSSVPTWALCGRVDICERGRNWAAMTIRHVYETNSTTSKNCFVMVNPSAQTTPMLCLGESVVNLANISKCLSACEFLPDEYKYLCEEKEKCDPSPCETYNKLFPTSQNGCSFEKKTNTICYGSLDKSNIFGRSYELRNSHGESVIDDSGWPANDDICVLVEVVALSSDWESFTASNEPVCKDDSGDGDDDTGTGGGGTGGGDGGGGTGGGGTGGGDGGGGTGGGGSGGGDGDDSGDGDNGSGTGDGDGDDSGTYSGDGGMGSIDGLDGMDKDGDSLKGLFDDLIDGLMNSDTVQAIKGHRYISVESANCNWEFTFWKHRYQISLCHYETELRKFGNILFGLVSLFGFIYVLRS